MATQERLFVCGLIASERAYASVVFLGLLVGGLMGGLLSPTGVLGSAVAGAHAFIMFRPSARNALAAFDAEHRFHEGYEPPVRSPHALGSWKLALAVACLLGAPLPVPAQ